ncbi:MAG: hypothetical protein GY820_21320 [Gammaproteobacteria bacterium]|nr:hypothetical protein [Gammaproteobacteria bacterium]
MPLFPFFKSAAESSPSTENPCEQLAAPSSNSSSFVFASEAADLKRQVQQGSGATGAAQTSESTSRFRVADPVSKKKEGSLEFGGRHLSVHKESVSLVF